MLIPNRNLQTVDVLLTVPVHQKQKSEIDKIDSSRRFSLRTHYPGIGTVVLPGIPGTVYRVTVVLRSDRDGFDHGNANF